MTHGSGESRLLEEADIGGMAALHRLCFGDKAFSERFLRSRFFDPRVRAWVVGSYSGGQLVGTQALHALPCKIRGLRREGGVFTCGMTHPDFRGRGTFRRLVDDALELAFGGMRLPFVFTMPNDASLPRFTRMPGWHVVADRETWVGPTMSGPGRARRGSRDRCSCDEDGLDRLAERVALDYGGVCFVREHGVREWRFRDNPEFGYKETEARRAGRVVGWAIGSIRERFGVRACLLVDWLAEDVEGFVSAVADLREVARNEGAVCMMTVATQGVQRGWLRVAGFRKVPEWLPVRRYHLTIAPSPASESAALVPLDPREWQLTLGDFDAV